MKKNTLLYLDSHLVELAKKKGLNLSKVMEDTLNEILFERRGLGELSFWEFLVKMKDEMECEMYFLPFQVKRLRLENIGVFDRFEADFKKDDVNLIYGGGGAGKSTILRSIAYCFGIENKYFKEPGRLGKTGQIEVEVYPNSNLVTAEVKEGSIKTHFHNAGCILLDEPFARLNSRRAEAFLKQLTKLQKQVIVASKYEREALKDKNTILLRTDPADHTRTITMKQ